eukprot:12801172-Alexandrium_andersonii.AAC.1
MQRGHHAAYRACPESSRALRSLAVGSAAAGAPRGCPHSHLGRRAGGARAACAPARAANLPARPRWRRR